MERERREAHEAARAAPDRAAAARRAPGRGPRGDRAGSARGWPTSAPPPRPRPPSSGGPWPTPVPARDLDLEAAVTEADRELAEALAELATLRTASQAQGEQLAALRRAEAARQAETETARRRLAEAERRAAEETARGGGRRRASRGGRGAPRGRARRRSRRPLAAESPALATREAARAALETAEAERAATADRAAAASAAVAGLRGRAEALADRLAEEERRPIARAARKAGGRRLDEDLAVDPGLRAAVEAALADRARAYLVAAASGPDLAAERGRLARRGAAVGRRSPITDAATRRCLDAVAAAGGGRLADAVRRDATGGVRRLLARAVWLPDLAACLAIQASLPPGWVAVPATARRSSTTPGSRSGAADSRAGAAGGARAPRRRPGTRRGGARRRCSVPSRPAAPRPTRPAPRSMRLAPRRRA